MALSNTKWLPRGKKVWPELLGPVTAVARGGFSKGEFGIWLKIGRFRGLGGPGVL